MQSEISCVCSPSLRMQVYNGPGGRWRSRNSTELVGQVPDLPSAAGAIRGRSGTCPTALMQFRYQFRHPGSGDQRLLSTLKQRTEQPVDLLQAPRSRGGDGFDDKRLQYFLVHIGELL